MTNNLSENEISELACTYASLILHDDNIPVTAEKIEAILKAANIEIPSYWPSLFAKALANKNIDDLILNAGGTGGAAPAPVAAGNTTTTSDSSDKKEKPKEEKKKEEPKEESDEDMGFGLFD